MKVAAALAGTIAAGLASRRFPVLAPLFGKYPGDLLWALAVYFGWAWLFPSGSRAQTVVLAAASSLVIELLKFYQTDWAVALRSTTFGRLVFGQVFSWQNLIAYAAGIAAGWLVDAQLRARPENQ